MTRLFFYKIVFLLVASFFISCGDFGPPGVPVNDGLLSQIFCTGDVSSGAGDDCLKQVGHFELTKDTKIKIIHETSGLIHINYSIITNLETQKEYNLTTSDMNQRKPNPDGKIYYLPKGHYEHGLNLTQTMHGTWRMKSTVVSMTEAK